MKNIAIIDYGSGNLRSAAKAFEKVCAENFPGSKVALTSNADDLKTATHIVLPGVGAFVDCMNGLKKIPGMVAAMETQVLKNKKPFLGICVGMQLLADTGNEHGVHKGLGWINGTVEKITPLNNLPVPHMGWNNLQSKKNALTNNLTSDVYFVHSYQFRAANNNDVVATTDYGGEITAAISRGNISGVQFHPEKSQQAGLQLIKNFLQGNANGS